MKATLRWSIFAYFHFHVQTRISTVLSNCAVHLRPIHCGWPLLLAARCREYAHFREHETAEHGQAVINHDRPSGCNSIHATMHRRGTVGDRLGSQLGDKRTAGTRRFVSQLRPLLAATSITAPYLLYVLKLDIVRSKWRSVYLCNSPHLDATFGSHTLHHPLSIRLWLRVWGCYTKLHRHDGLKCLALPIVVKPP